LKKYEEAVLLAYHLWEKKKENENPEERGNDVRESTMQLIERTCKEEAVELFKY
jgi:hypothetical protein